MMNKDRKAREVYNQKVERVYYTSAKFHKDMSMATINVASRMGVIEALCNVFLTTAKNVVTIIRQTWAYIVEALKILFINPQGAMHLGIK